MRLQECALEAFERAGFERTTTAQIAAAAGVSQVTFFRYFPSKEAAALWDPFDPMIAESIRRETDAATALQAACRGIWRTWSTADLTAVEPVARRRVRLVAGSATLRSAMWAGHADTEAALIGALRERFDAFESSAAAGACLGALTTVLLTWAETEPYPSLTSAIATALRTLDPEGIT
ncbi:Transcriptional regulator, TetR family [Stackebrandtia soli]